MDFKKTTPPPRTAVILSSCANALGAVRSLHKAGVPTIAIAESRNEPVMYSRWPKRKLLVPSSHPENRERDLFELLLTLEENRPVLIPTSDAFVSFISKNRKRLAERFDFCIPDDRLVELLNDKVKETRLIASLGISLPRTVQDIPSSPSKLIEQLGLPIIIKPRSFEHFSLLGKKNFVIRSSQEMDSFYEKFHDSFWELLAQEVVPGADDTLWICHCTFSRSHELLAAFTYKKLRMSPPHFGVVSYGISQRNQEVNGLASTLGKTLQYTGTGSVEFKYDARDGQYKYIEFNPRLPLSNLLATTCGVNNVLYSYQLAIGADPEPTHFQQRDGVIYLILLEDLSSRLKDGESILSVLRHYLAHAHLLHVEAYFAWNDMGPALFRIIRVFVTVGEKLWPKLVTCGTWASAFLRGRFRTTTNPRKV